MSEFARTSIQKEAIEIRREFNKKASWMLHERYFWKKEGQEYKRE